MSGRSSGEPRGRDVVAFSMLAGVRKTAPVSSLGLQWPPSQIPLVVVTACSIL